MRLNAQLKTDYTAAPYLSAVSNHHLRRAIAQLRCSSHHLHIMTGAWRKPITPHEERFCSRCPRQGIQAIEDEQHFTMECPQYHAMRLKYSSLFTPSVNTFPDLMRSQNQYLLGKFLTECLALQKATQS